MRISERELVLCWLIRGFVVVNMTDFGTIPADSIEPANRFNEKSRLPRSQATGKLHKGQGYLGAAVSIPSKYQTIVSDNSEKRGFGSCSKRFNEEQSMTEGPDPSHYQRASKSAKDNVSFSKRGTGTFASKSKRFQRLKNKDTSVAPGQYEPLHHTSTDFNRAACTSNFHQPIAVAKDVIKKESTPAPNHYNLPHKITGRPPMENNNTVSAAFKSKTRRELVDLRCLRSNPAPGTYNIGDDMARMNIRHTTAPFKSTTFRNFLGSTNSYPGPGTYNPFETASMPDIRRLPRQHYLCIAAPAIPLPPSPPSPGPGHYSLVNYEGEERKFVSGASFVSTTNRLMEHLNRDRGFEPGPATYNPQQIGKQSFIYNIDSKWI